MSNWLAKLSGAGNSGFVGLAGYSSTDLSRIISDGANAVARMRRIPQMPSILHEDPIEGVAVIRDQTNWQLYLAGVIAVAFKERRWIRHQFYYRCLDIPRIRETRAWRDLVSGVSGHGLEPLLVCEKDVFVFDGQDWMLCEVKLCLA